jgi:hypothetical protein
MDIQSPTGVRATYEIRQALNSTATTTLDCSLYNAFVVTLAASITTLTLSNVPASGNVYTLTLFIVQGAGPYTITWPAAVKWPGASAPTLTTTNGKIDVITLVTYDGGTTWLGFLGGQNF